MLDTRSETRRMGSRYGAFAFATIIVSCFAGFFFTQRYYVSAPWAVPVTFALGAAYAVLGIIGSAGLECRPARLSCAAYYLLQCALVTAMIFLSPIRGFFGLIALPLASQSIFDLRGRTAALVCTYLYAINIVVWAVPFGWAGATQALLNYSAGFAFTIVFTLITRQSLVAREREETLRRELEAANAQLRAHAAQAGELATTRERNRLAREIHDGVGHYLTVVKTQLDAAAALLATDPARAELTLRKASRLAHEVLEDVRRSVGTLRTDVARPALPDALRDLVAHAEPAAQLRFEGTPRPLNAAAEHALFRTAQEGLTNIRKHARAGRAELILDYRTPNLVRLDLIDDGIGRNGASGHGFGLVGIRERTESLGGSMHAGPRPEGGFSLRVELPA